MLFLWHWSLKMYVTFDLRIQFLGIYPIEFTNINKDVFIVAILAKM